MKKNVIHKIYKKTTLIMLIMINEPDQNEIIRYFM